MPTKNTVRNYVIGGIYHIYNRGVEKRNIFIDEQDYNVFLYYLKSYLLPLNLQSKPPSGIKYLRNFSLHNEIKLIAYCLMPTHFHFMVKQGTEKAITEFMKRLSNAYVEYFNKRYIRVGALFQGRYRAVLVTENNHFSHLTRYIHLNPAELFTSHQTLRELCKYPYSSYRDYIGRQNSQWLDKDMITEGFKSKQDEFGFTSYQNFVEKFAIESRETLKNITID